MNPARGGRDEAFDTVPMRSRSPHLAAKATSEGFARSSNALAFDLHRALRAGGTNLAFSPLSVSTALTVAWAGARGETAAEMQRVLHADVSATEALTHAGRLLADLKVPTGITLHAANRIFGERAYPFERAYLDLVAGACGVELESVDFTAPESARQRINAWVAGETAGRITNPIPPHRLTSDTRLALVNATYFLGKWWSPFRHDSTFPAPFHGPTRVDVPTMHDTDTLNYCALDGVQVLELRYQGGGTSMTFVLPDDIDGLDALETRITPALLGTWTAAMRAETVSVSLPRFDIGEGRVLSLGDTLAPMGMPTAFARNRADFSDIATAPAGDEPLRIGQILHAAVVKLDEDGTEAAAATVVTQDVTASLNRSLPTEFKADHPFLFFLRHVPSGAILFMGRVVNPAEP